jgi:hypothetical protein
MPAPLGNKHGCKPVGTQASAEINIRVHPRDKARFVKAARPGKLTPWIIAACHHAADKTGVSR